MIPAALGAFFASCLFSQTLNVYSEFVRLDAKGVVQAPASPREILSPMLVRNGFTSFQIAIDAKAGEPYTLFIGLNPQDAVKVTVYRETVGRLDPVDLPFKAEGPAAFWLDVWCDAGAPVRRIKIEPELYADGDFVRYPMEARVMDATVPAPPLPKFPDPRELLCGPMRRYYSYLNTPDSARLQDRNRAQDAALASRVSKASLARGIGDCYSIDWANPEAYLRIRDYLFRLR